MWSAVRSNNRRQSAATEGAAGALRLRSKRQARQMASRWLLRGALALALLAGLGGQSSGGPASRVPWPERWAQFLRALRDPALSLEQRYALEVAIHEAVLSETRAGVSEGLNPAWQAEASADDGDWRRISAPVPRSWHTAIYESVNRRMVAFGGQYCCAAYDDAFALSLGENPTWTPLPVAPFGNTSGHTAIYDPLRERMVVFGIPNVNDVWALSLGESPTWTMLATAGDPPPSRGWRAYRAIYDPPRDRMVVFAFYPSSDVWALSLGESPTWTMLATAGDPPPPQYPYPVIYDPPRDRAVIFTGSDVFALSLGETPTWARIITVGGPPDGLFLHTAIYDPIRDRIVVSGDGNHVDEVWALSLGAVPTWHQLPDEPIDLHGETAVYEPVGDRMVVFGGFDSDGAARDDVWALSLGGTPSWTILEPVGRTPCAPWDGAVAVAYDPLRDQMVTGGCGWFTLRLGGAPLWTELIAGGAPPPAHPVAALHDALRDRMIVFGYGGLLWTLQLGGAPTWNQIVPEGPPPLGASHRVYDPLRDRVVVLDIEHAAVWALLLGETPTWTELSAEGTPPPAGSDESYAVIHDPIRDRVVVFGGSRLDPPNVWALSLGEMPMWTQILPAGDSPPSPWPGWWRWYDTAIYDPVRDRMVIVKESFPSEPRWVGAWALSLGETPTWRTLTPAGLPPTVCSRTVVYDPLRDRLLKFGGLGDSCDLEPLSDVWALTWGTPLLPPPSLVAESGPGSITLHWTPSPSDNVVAYRISYGPQNEAVRYTGDQAAEGPSGMEVPVGQTSFTLTCMPDSVFHLVVQAVAASGGRSAWSQEVLVQPQPITASEVCNGVDDDCDGEVDEGPTGTDQDSDGIHDACDLCPLDPENDADADGVCGDADACANSNLGLTVSVAGCDTGVSNMMFITGCTLQDRINLCGVGVQNHGEFVSCVSHLADELNRQGVLTGRQKGRLQQCAGRSNRSAPGDILRRF